MREGSRVRSEPVAWKVSHSLVSWTSVQDLAHDALANDQLDSVTCLWHPELLTQNGQDMFTASMSSVHNMDLTNDLCSNAAVVWQQNLISWKTARRSIAQSSADVHHAVVVEIRLQPEEPVAALKAFLLL